MNIIVFGASRGTGSPVVAVATRSGFTAHPGQHRRHQPLARRRALQAGCRLAAGWVATLSG